MGASPLPQRWASRGGREQGSANTPPRPLPGPRVSFLGVFNRNQPCWFFQIFFPSFGFSSRSLSPKVRGIAGHIEQAERGAIRKSPQAHKHFCPLLPTAGFCIIRVCISSSSSSSSSRALCLRVQTWELFILFLFFMKAVENRRGEIKAAVRA